MCKSLAHRLPTRAVALYSAAQSADALVDFPLDTALKKSTPVNIIASEKLFHLCKQMVEDRTWIGMKNHMVN